MKKAIILNKYDFNLMSGGGIHIEGDPKSVSYYHYLNNRPTETGKNIQAVAWLLENQPEGSTVFEPFGGCGVFAVAIQNLLKPKQHKIIEIDNQCYEQLKFCLDGTNAEIINGDSHVHMGETHADIFVCDFPVFNIRKFTDNSYWKNEFDKMIKQKPNAIIVTDGAAFFWHFSHKTWAKRLDNITDHRESYVYAVNKVYNELYGYCIKQCGYHANCFYYKLEPGTSDHIEFKYIPAGSSGNGLRFVDSE